jgi:hypothetical protein
MSALIPYRTVDIQIRGAQITEVDDYGTVTVIYSNEETGEVFEATVATSTPSVTVEPVEAGESR